MDLFDLLQDDVEDREHLLGPWLQAGDQNMIFAPRGVGKTRVATRIAHTLATGGELLKWKAPRCVKVAYFDGEMGREQMWRMLTATEEASDRSIYQDTFKVYPYDSFVNSQIPDLSEPSGQAKYDELSKGSEVIIIDNLLSCARPQGRNDSDVSQWGRIQNWLIKKRKEGVAVILIHHSGKSGEQLGTSVRENILDSIVGLKPSRCVEDEEYGIEWHFTKTRNFFGKDTEALHVKIGKDSSGIERWDIKSLWEAKKDKFFSLSHKYGKDAAQQYMGFKAWEVAKAEKEDANGVGRHQEDDFETISVF